MSAKLARMFRARRVAVIGASERNPFSAPVIRNFDRFGYAGEVLLVNPRGEPVHGRATLRHVRELDGPIDAAFVCVPSAAVLQTVADACEAGVTGFVIVSSGFAEAGDDGRRQQEALRRLADERGVALLGPNALGFVNFVDGVPLSVLERKNRRGSFGIASVSGSVGGYLGKIAELQGIGLSHMVLAGNEAGATIADILDFLVDDPDTRSIGVFLEAVYDPARFARAAERALRAHKPIVMLKAGADANTARLAAAHTGALVGEDRVFDAAAREMGVCRVDSYEDMIATAMLLEVTGPIARPGVAALTISGGSGEILSDLAGAAGVSFPPFSPPVRAALEPIVSSFGAANNPLDVTGAALADPGLWERVLTAIAADEEIGLALCIWDLPSGRDEAWMTATLEAISRGYAGYGRAPPLIGTVVEPSTEFARETLAAAGLPGAIAGLKPAVTALAHLAAWSRRALDPRAVALFRAPALPPPARRPIGERALLDWLGERGVPVTPGVVAGDAGAAAAAADRFGYPVALKVAAPAIAHKSDIGGVKLGLADAAGVRAAFAEIMASCSGVGPIDGVIVSPMRDVGLELIVALTRDPVWGPMLVLGLGGIWVELLDDAAMLPVPVDRRRVADALRSLKAAKLFAGARGRQAIDVEAVAAAIVAIADAAAGLGPELLALEINPLAILRDRVEAMDALAVWAD